MNETITFCKNKCCPVVEVLDEQIRLGDENGPEGVTTWSYGQFKDFVDAAKRGYFDHIID